MEYYYKMKKTYQGKEEGKKEELSYISLQGAGLAINDQGQIELTKRNNNTK